MACSYCGEDGHNKKTCPNVRRCSICNEPGHNSRTCNKKEYVDNGVNNHTLPSNFESLPCKIIDIHDGDTIIVKINNKHGLGNDNIWVRFRGVDAPESNTDSDKFEKDIDRSKMCAKEMTALGRKSTKKLKELLTSGDHYFLECERSTTGQKPYLHHNQFRLLAYLVDHEGIDMCEKLIQTGYALTWPRRDKPGQFVHHKYAHPKIDTYISTCNQARKCKTGLWNEGLIDICPIGRKKSIVTLDECNKFCNPKYAS